MSKKVAVVLFNLGGPDKLSSVKPFLFNLFYDPNILRIANPFRWLIAKIISTKREKKTQQIYTKMGGRSTILSFTKKQAQELEKKLNQQETNNYKVFVSMRYWHPFVGEVVEDLKKYKPDEIFLLPLYPQFSTTTTKSSLEEFYDKIHKSSLSKITLKTVCCYYSDKNFISVQADLIKEKVVNLKEKYRILFSAHSLPEKIITQGDPYQWQIEETCLQIVKELNIVNLDYTICYQSKVGPLKWLAPSTENEIIKAAKEEIAVVIVPISFVSEHSETLVELDIEYKNLFNKMCNKPYIRISTVNDKDGFIQTLYNQVNLMKENDINIGKKKVCIFSKKKCPQNKFKDCFYNINK